MKKVLLILIVILFSLSVNADSKKKLFPTAKEGGIFDASSLNHVYQTIENSVLGFQSSSDLLGKWECTNITTNCESRIGTEDGGIINRGLYQSRSQIVTFTKDSNDYWFTPNEASFFGCHDSIGKYLTPYRYQVTNSIIIYIEDNDTSVHANLITKFSNNSFIINKGYENIVCQRLEVPPDLPTALETTKSDTQITLSWSGVEGISGYKIYRRVLDPDSTTDISEQLAGIDYSLLVTVDQDILTYTDKTCIGDCYHKVKAFNDYGESESSNVTRVSIEKIK